jgi:RhtB (resistance to homoserine/threonine) family protein
MIDLQVIAFAGIAALLTITPGADTMMILRNVFARGRTAGVLTMIGICSGLFFHASLSALGLSLILVRSATAFQIVKLIGVCYLVYLGAQSLWKARRDAAKTSGSLTHDAKSGSAELRKAFFEGLMTNVLNPKVAIFYLAFLPQFITPQDWVFGKSVLLASIHFSQGLIWYSILIYSFARMRMLLGRPRVKQVFEAISGIVLIGFGLRLAAERR